MFLWWKWQGNFFLYDSGFFSKNCSKNEKRLISLPESTFFDLFYKVNFLSYFFFTCMHIWFESTTFQLQFPVLTSKLFFRNIEKEWFDDFFRSEFRRSRGIQLHGIIQFSTWLLVWLKRNYHSSLLTQTHLITPSISYHIITIIIIYIITIIVHHSHIISYHIV